MNILHLSDAKTWYGGEIQLAELLPNLKELGVHSSVFCWEGTPLDLFCKKQGIAVFSQKRAPIFSLIKALKNCIEHNSIDIVHIHTSRFFTLYVLTDFLYNLNAKAIYHKKLISKNGNSFLSRWKYNYKNVAYIIAVSQKIKESLKKVVRPQQLHKVKVIYDGIPMKVNPPEFDIRDKFNIRANYLMGSLANHTPQKDLATTLYTLNTLVKEHQLTDIHLVQIGKETEYSPDLYRLAKELNLTEYITFTGGIDEGKRYLSQFDVFLITSNREGGPLTVYESFLQKTPVVSTKVGVVPEVIDDGKNGFLSEIGDYKNLAKQIKTLLENKALQNQFINNSYQKVIQQFDAKKSAEQVVELYKDILS